MKKIVVLLTMLFATLTIFSQPKWVGNLQWSDRSSNEMNWNYAVNYCQNLQESGYSDWRLPNVDELRTLIQNCPQTETGGQCKVSEKQGCLLFDCMRPDGSCYCEVRKNNGGYYSKLGDDSVVLWSSSTGLDVWPTDTACYVGFTNGIVFIYEKSSLNYVRCVRDNSKPSSSEEEKARVQYEKLLAEMKENEKRRQKEGEQSSYHLTEEEIAQFSRDFDNAYYEAVAEKTITNRIADIKRCYDNVKKNNPSLKGKIVVSILINKKGRVSNINILEDTLKNAEVAKCIKSIIGRLSFPEPEGSSESVTFPFMFSN